MAKDNLNSSKIARSEAFMIDNEIPPVPNLQVNAEKNSTISKTLEIEISGSNSPSGIAKYQYSLNDGKTWLDVSVGQRVVINNSGVYQIKARAVNNVGTEGNETERYEVTISKSALTVAFVPKEDESYKKEHSTQVIIGTSNEIDSLKYLWTTKEGGVLESEITNSFTNKQTIIKNSESGTWYLWILTKDNAGNTILQRSGKFNLDNGIPTKPTITKKEDENREKVTLKISGSTALSGIAKYQYSLNNGTTWNDLTVGEDLLLDQMGDYQVKTRAVSNVGIPGEMSNTENISIKTRIPMIKFVPNGSKSYQNSQTTKIEVSSSFEIKEDTLKYLWSTKADGITVIDFEKTEAQLYSNLQTINKNKDSGIWYIWAFAENNNGDTKIQRSEPFYLDNDNPTIEGVENSQIYHKEVTLIIKDVTSEIAIEMMKDGIRYNYEQGNMIKEDGIYQITAIDEAGNMTSISFVMQYEEDDITGPMVNFTPNGNKQYKKEQTTKVEVIDQSEVKEETLKYLWSINTEKPKEEEFIEVFKNGDIIKNDKDTGKFYLWIYAEDQKGNKSILRSNEFYLDNTPPTKPTISANVKDGGTTEQEVIITIKSGDSESNTYNEYSLDDGKTWEKMDSNTIHVNTEGNTKILVVTVNETGLRSEVSRFTCTIKKEQQVDNTIAKDPIPQTGIDSVIFIIIITFFGIAVFSYVRLKRKY